MLLFIFESIGTSELILIGVVALIFLGPRKLPEIARKIGKITAEFRGTATEFKETWQREVDFEEERKAFDLNDLESETVAHDDEVELPPAAASPSVKELDAADFQHMVPTDDIVQPQNEDDTVATKAANDKKNWL